MDTQNLPEKFIVLCKNKKESIAIQKFLLKKRRLNWGDFLSNKFGGIYYHWLEDDPMYIEQEKDQYYNLICSNNLTLSMGYNVPVSSKSYGTIPKYEPYELIPNMNTPLWKLLNGVTND